MATVPLKGELHDLFSGVLHKVGGKVKTWNKRFFILKSDYCLYYFKDTTKGPLGTISLRDPKFKARKGEAGDISWPRNTKLNCTMAIVTSHRTYYVYCSYDHEIDEWIRMLTKANEKVMAQNRAENRLLSGNSSSQLKEQEKSHPEQEHAVSTGDMNYEMVYDNPEESKTVDKEQGTPTENVEPIYALASSVEVEVLYEDLQPTISSAQQQTTSEANIATSDDRDTVHSRQNQPLYDDILGKESQALYEDISETQQPLYESMDVQPNDSTEHLRQVGESHQDRESFVPPLPSRDVPPLPPRSEDLFPLPAEEDTPSLPLPSKENTPPLPLSAEDDAPPLLSKGSSQPNSSPTPTRTERSDAVESLPTNGIAPNNSQSHDDPEGTHKKPSPAPRRKFSNPQEVIKQPIAKPRVQHGSEQQQQEQLAKEQGMVMFKLQKQRLEELGLEDPKKRSESIRMLENVAADPTLSYTNKAVFAETLREVEQERLLASEERFKWERERKKLDEERLKFEEERRRLQEQF